MAEKIIVICENPMKEKRCVLYQLIPFSVLIYAPFSSSVNPRIGGYKLVPNVNQAWYLSIGILCIIIRCVWLYQCCQCLLDRVTYYDLLNIVNLLFCKALSENAWMFYFILFHHKMVNLNCFIHQYMIMYTCKRIILR